MSDTIRLFVQLPGQRPFDSLTLLGNVPPAVVPRKGEVLAESWRDEAGYRTVHDVRWHVTPGEDFYEVTLVLGESWNYDSWHDDE